MGSRLIQPSIRGANPKRLTPNQQMFVEQLLADESFNGTKAARAAGYKNPSVAANKLLHTPAVAAIIGKAIRRRMEALGLNSNDVLAHLVTVLYLDPIELFESTGNGAFRVKSLDEIPAPVRRCITKLKCRVKETDNGTESYVEIELMSKDAALPLVMKHLGLLGPDGNSVSVNVGTDLVASLLAQVEQDRRVVDTKFIEAKVLPSAS